MTDTIQPAAAVAPTADAAPADKKKGGWKSILWLVMFAWLLRSLVIAPFSIPSGSMLPTMWIGDYLFVQKWPYGVNKYSFPLDLPPIDKRIGGHLPARGDIAIFRLPADPSQVWVKRVIGLPGDRIAVTNGQLFLNGVAVPRVSAGEIAIPVSPNSPCRTFADGLNRSSINASGEASCVTPAWKETLPGGPSYLTFNSIDGSPGDDFAEMSVPAGHVFMMGDNRDDSLDSRFSPAMGGVGLLPVENLVGRATVPFWSTDGSASWINPISWFTALRGDRIGHSYNR